MSVMLGAAGKVLLTAGGNVAIDPSCCCGGGDCSCPPAHPCAVSFDLTFNDPCTDTTIVFSEAFKQLQLTLLDCGTVIGDFLTSCWQFSSTFPSCAITFEQFLNWPADSFCETITFQLIHYCGPWCESEATGWYLQVVVNGDNPLHHPFDCCQFANYDGGASCITGLYLGTNPFTADLPFTTDLDGGGSYGTSFGTITGTFHFDCP
jgi:hypothetical protein